jgi:hypothetical protein
VWACFAHPTLLTDNRSPTTVDVLSAAKPISLARHLLLRAIISPADGSAPFGIGHNAGPPLDPGAGWRFYCWKKAHARAWKTPPREIALARLARARSLGISYRQHTAALLDTGVHL